MRFLCFLFLLVFAGAVGVFIYQNEHEVTVTFLNWHVTQKIALVVGAAFGRSVAQHRVGDASAARNARRRNSRSAAPACSGCWPSTAAPSACPLT